jgi:cell division septal protein FtsQ
VSRLERQAKRNVARRIAELAEAERLGVEPPPPIWSAARQPERQMAKDKRAAIWAVVVLVVIVMFIVGSQLPDPVQEAKVRDGVECYNDPSTC